MSTYYAYEDVKKKIAHRLLTMDGWKVYGYHADESDSMTDYYSPAYWGGIATKNGYTLVIDKSRPQEERRDVVKVYGEQTAETAEKIKKLEAITQERGASEQEEQTAREKIEILRAKDEAGTTTKEIYTPGHMANPPRCNWHIEKDGIIYDKGTGLLKFSSVPDISGYGYGWERESWQKFNTQTPEEWKAELINYFMERGYYSDKEKAEAAAESRYNDAKESYAKLDKFNELIARFNNVCGGLVGNTAEAYTYEEVTKTEYKKEIKAQETGSGSLKDGQLFIVKSHGFNYGVCAGYVYRIHAHEGADGKTYYTAQRLNGKLTKELTGSANPANFWGYIASEKDNNRFMSWIERGALAWCELVEVSTPYEVKKVVKKKIQKAEEPTTQQTETLEKEPETMNEIKTTDNIHIGAKFEDAAGNIHTITELNDMSVKIGDSQTLYDFGTSRTVGAIINAIESTAGKGVKCIYNPTNAKPQTEEEPTEAEETAEETPQEPQESPETETAEEVPTAEENAPETDENEPTQDEPQPVDMFAQFAQAYVTGKSAPKPAKAEPQEEPEEPEPEEPEPEPEPIKPGYFDNDNDKLTAEELQALNGGGQIVTPESWYKVKCFATAYNDTVKMVYGVRVDESGNIRPGDDADCKGFLINGNYFYIDHLHPIRQKLSEDINARLLEMIPDEHSAAITAANVTDWQKRDIDSYKNHDYTKAAQNLFYDGKKPILKLYGKRDFSNTEIIDYLQDAPAVIEKFALAYMCDNPHEIYKDYIEYNRTKAIYDEIRNDKSRTEHKLLEISKAIKDEKTVKIELSNGHTVKVEADAVKRITYSGYISDYSVAACDRQYLRRNEYNRADDIYLEDIKAIYHGGRTLYKAA